MIIQSQIAKTNNKDSLLQVSCNSGFYDIVRFPEYNTETASNLLHARRGCPRVPWTQTRARRGPNAGALRARRGQSRRKTRAGRGPDAGRRSAKLFLGGTVCIRLARYCVCSLY